MKLFKLENDVFWVLPVTILFSAILLQGCAQLTAGRHKTSALNEIELGMEMEDVQKQMGRPNVTRVAKKLSANSVYELHEYKLYSSACVKTLSFFLFVPVYPFCDTETLWLHYVDYKLVFWGEKGDWQGTPKWFNK